MGVGRHPTGNRKWELHGKIWDIPMISYVFLDCKCWLKGISDHLVCLEMGTLNFADLDMTIYDGNATVE